MKWNFSRILEKSRGKSFCSKKKERYGEGGPASWEIWSGRLPLLFSIAWIACLKIQFGKDKVCKRVILSHLLGCLGWWGITVQKALFLSYSQYFPCFFPRRMLSFLYLFRKLAHIFNLPSPPAVASCFQDGVLFCTDNAKFWPILAYWQFFSQIHALFSVFLY